MRKWLHFCPFMQGYKNTILENSKVSCLDNIVFMYSKVDLAIYMFPWSVIKDY